MSMELTYEKVMLDEYDAYEIVECYPDGRRQVISEDQDVYQAWLALGNQPTVIPYVPPEPPAPPTQTDLDNTKVNKITQIDYKTEQLVYEGFEYDYVMFSLSPAAQMNWLGMQARIDYLTFPMGVSTLAEEIFILTDTADCEAFLTTAFDTVVDRKEAGVTLRAQIMAIYLDTEKTIQERIDEINAFVDPR